MFSKPESTSEFSSLVMAEEELVAYQGVKSKKIKVGIIYLLKVPE